MKTRPVPYRRFPVAAAALACSAAALLAGCEQESEALRQLEDVQLTLRSLSADGAAPASASLRRTKYQQSVQTLQKIQGSVEETHEAATARLLARAQAGLAMISVEEATSAAANAQRKTAAARIVIDRYAERHALAAALEAPDPADELDRIAEERRAKEQELESLRSEREQMVAEIEELRSRAESRGAEAKRRRAEAGQIRADALDAPARERADMIEQAVAVEGDANEAESQAELIRARINRREPELKQVDEQITRAERQLELFDLAVQSLRQREDVTEASAAENREKAAEAARELDERIAAAGDVIAEDFAPALDSAISGLQSALSTQRRVAQGGSNEARTAARLAVGRLHQTLGDMHRLRATTLQPFVLMLEQAASIKPALPEAGRYAEQAETLRTRMTSAREEARAAYGEARSAFENAGVRGEAADRLQSVVDRLGALSAASDGEAGATP